MIKLIRCDDRLVHGQCVTSILKHYDIAKIIVIDDYTAGNALMKKIYQTAVPSSVKLDVVTQAAAVEAVKNAMADSASYLVLMRLPTIIAKLYGEVSELPKDLNIANVAAKNGTVNVTTYARMDDAEIAAVKEMAARGVHIWFNQVPGTPVTEWESIKNKY